MNLAGSKNVAIFALACPHGNFIVPFNSSGGFSFRDGTEVPGKCERGLMWTWCFMLRLWCVAVKYDSFLFDLLSLYKSNRRKKHQQATTANNMHAHKNGEFFIFTPHKQTKHIIDVKEYAWNMNTHNLNKDHVLSKMFHFFLWFIFFVPTGKTVRMFIVWWETQ